MQIGSDDGREAAAGALGNILSGCNASNAGFAADNGALGQLLYLCEHSRMETKEVAATAMGNLLLSDPTKQTIFLALGGMPAVLRGIEYGSESVQEEASHALLALVLDNSQAKP